MPETPTPAPLTDEQIDSIRVSVRAAYLHGLLSDERRAFYEAEFDAWHAAVVARAKREERRRLWHAINPLIDGVTEESVSERLCSHLINITIVEAYRLGVATALMETVKETSDD